MLNWQPSSLSENRLISVNSCDEKLFSNRLLVLLQSKLKFTFFSRGDMQLAITILSQNATSFTEQILSSIKRCQCEVLEMRCTRFSEVTACQILIAGNWNYIARLETLLQAMKTQTSIQMSLLRQEPEAKQLPGLPYVLETIGAGGSDIIHAVVVFLEERQIAVEEIQGSRYPAPYNQAPVFATRFVIIIPPEQQLLQLREDFLEFCDQLNIDAILEPIKR